MSIKETYKYMRDLLSNISSDLEKAENGNKAASQRVRTGTVRLEKIAKLFRKESISFEKKNKGQKKPSKTTSASKGGKSASSKSTASKPASKGKSGTSSKPKSTVKAKPKAKATSFRPRQLSVKRATAKLPTRRFSA